MQRQHIKELEGDYLGYKFVVLFHPFGHRCGYVAVDRKIHKLKELLKLDVHGTVTYDERGLPNGEYKDTRWIGFDCNHAYDYPDFNSIIEYYGELNKSELEQRDNLEYFQHTHVWTLDEVRNEIKNLIEQLKGKVIHGYSKQQVSSDNYDEEEYDELDELLDKKVEEMYGEW